MCGMKLVPVKTSRDEKTNSAKSAKALFYRNPMNPTITSPVPMKDEMGMDYVPVYADSEEALRVAPAMRAQLGLRTVAVRRGKIADAISTSARVAVDETRVAEVQARVDGFVETLRADYTGKQVRRGEALASIYSPEVLAAEDELLLALRSREALAGVGLPDAAGAARERLRRWGVSAAQIAAVERSGKAARTFAVTAPIAGTVTTKNAVLGARVDTAKPLFVVTDLSRVWVLADVYERELGRVRVGDAATVTAQAFPGRSWRGRVGFVAPVLDSKTRTAEVRIEVANEDSALRPEMFARVEIATAPHEALLVPDDAVIDSGTRRVVYVTGEGDALTPREIEVGLRANGQYEVRSGLREGERVVLGASFLLDSEARLRSALRGPEEHDADGHGAHEHGAVQ